MSNAAANETRAAVTYVAKNIRGLDRIWASDSLVTRAQKRASALDMAPESRAAMYPLAWALETGRASTAFEQALLALDPRKLAAAAIEIAAMETSVSKAWEAWKLAIAA